MGVPASGHTLPHNIMSPKAATSRATTLEGTCASIVLPSAARTPPADALLVSRRFSPVYEYPLNGQWIMMDIDDGYILWTGIWKGAPTSRLARVRAG